ncbi:hypothetical protein [Chromobacterium subtsugae]|uniref:hypothetical protein n=1 Tax=Chromobacterium subtsugae TaxID=251747 RepID=UPI000B0FDF80|nr:hypothetical protein [Chromobacterium subtsugae]MBW7568799.1 hypothetical protein [Chromobacterium subtsugae]WSE90949.1 hypothetical protein U6115_19000 [Chromobacterium subtsugae]WVH59322.1 hypothetical protein U6151_19030 [Chromobacterium subtsugae]
MLVPRPVRGAPAWCARMLLNEFLFLFKQNSYLLCRKPVEKNRGFLRIYCACRIEALGGRQGIDARQTGFRFCF